MMSNSINHNTSVVARIIEQTSRKLPLPLSEAFMARIKAGYCDLPVTTLVKGDYTVGQQFSIIRTSVKELKEEAKSTGSILPWEEMWNVCLDILEKTSYSSAPTTTPKEVSSTSGRKSSAKPNNQLPTTSVAVPKAVDLKSSGGQKPTPKPSQHSAPSDQNVIRQIREVLRKEKVSGSRPIYDRKGQRYVKCKSPDCRFCSTMYESLHLTSCERFGHPPCNSAGWFPHVGITMWKSLRRQHDAGAPFVAKDSTPKPGELPSLSSSAPSEAPAFGTTPNAIAHKRKRIDEGPLSPASTSSSSWADEVDQEQ